MDLTKAYDRMSTVAAAGTLGLAILTMAVPADAGSSNAGKARHAQASAQKPRPQGDYTRHTEVRRTEDGKTRNDTWTGTRGTATRTDVTQRTGTGYTRNSTAAGPQGGTATRGVVATRDAASGTWTKDVSVNRTPPPAPTPADGG